MERHNINIMPLPPSGEESYISVLESLFAGCKIYEASEDEENRILQEREVFKAAVTKFKAPWPIPTLYRNHHERGAYVELEHRRQKLDPKNPPDEIPVTFVFAEDIFANIVIKFSKDYPQGKQKPYLLRDEEAHFITLRKEFCAEDAFEEALSRSPAYYFLDPKKAKKSRYVEPDVRKWYGQIGCLAEYSKVDDNDIQFLVDISIIYPENIWSTAAIICYDCGKIADISLCDAVKEAARKEIWQNILMLDVQKKVSENPRCVVRLPTTCSLHPFCAFREGLMGFTPLTQTGSAKPSLFVRVRITYYTTEASRIGHVLHSRKGQKPPPF